MAPALRIFLKGGGGESGDGQAGDRNDSNHPLSIQTMPSFHPHSCLAPGSPLSPTHHSVTDANMAAFISPLKKKLRPLGSV
jgi:hypothetical protein